MKLALIYNEDHIRLGWASTKARLEAAKDALIGVGLEAKLENGEKTE